MNELYDVVLTDEPAVSPILASSLPSFGCNLISGEMPKIDNL